MEVAFDVHAVISAKPAELFDAWLDSEKHGAMTGGDATVSREVGDEFMAWDGYIRGTNVSVEPPRRIVQTWRTTEFSDDARDSLLEIDFIPSGNNTEVKIRHSRLPADGIKYRQGWISYYFEPMEAFFTSEGP